MMNVITSCILILGVFFLNQEFKSEIQNQKDLTVRMVTNLANAFECEANLPNKDSIKTIVVTCKDGKLVTLSGETGGIQVLKK
jgi:hypothetical protein